MNLKDVMAGRGGTQSPSQNLINPTKVSGLGSQAGTYKSMVLDGLSIVSALSVGYTYVGYLSSGFSPWWVLAAFLFFGMFAVLQAFLANHTTRATLVILAEAVVLVAPFIWYDSIDILLLTALIVFVFLLLGYFGSKADIKNAVELRFFGTTRSVLGKLVTAVLFFMILVYAPQVGQNGVFVPRQSFKTFFDWTAGFLNKFYPNIPWSGSFGNFSTSVAQMELANNPTFQSLPAEDQQTAVSQESQAIATNVASTSGVVPTQNEQMSDVVYQYVAGALGNWRTEYQNGFVIGWVLVVFVILRTVGIVFVWLAQLAALALYELLLAVGFMHITEIPQTKEVVEYS